MTNNSAIKKAHCLTYIVIQIFAFGKLSLLKTALHTGDSCYGDMNTNQHFAVAVVICFFLCWSPYHAQRLLFSYLTLTGRWNGVLVKVHHYLYWSSGKVILI